MVNVSDSEMNYSCVGMNESGCKKTRKIQWKTSQKKYYYGFSIKYKIIIIIKTILSFKNPCLKFCGCMFSLILEGWKSYKIDEEFLEIRCLVIWSEFGKYVRPRTYTCKSKIKSISTHMSQKFTCHKITDKIYLVSARKKLKIIIIVLFFFYVCFGWYRLSANFNQRL